MIIVAKFEHYKGMIYISKPPGTNFMKPRSEYFVFAKQFETDNQPKFVRFVASMHKTLTCGAVIPFLPPSASFTSLQPHIKSGILLKTIRA